MFYPNFVQIGPFNSREKVSGYGPSQIDDSMWLICALATALKFGKLVGYGCAKPGLVTKAEMTDGMAIQS